IPLVPPNIYGSLAEWPIALVLKTREVKASGGSNPSASANSTLGKTMFPIHTVYDVSLILSALEEHGGVFIRNHDLHHLGKATFAAAKYVFASSIEIPTPDADSMFPNSVETLPGASRRVIQR